MSWQQEFTGLGIQGGEAEGSIRIPEGAGRRLPWCGDANESLDGGDGVRPDVRCGTSAEYLPAEQ
jgi:hypothetical protein